jgi:phospholipid-binding lipoprotein MlaA
MRFKLLFISLLAFNLYAKPNLDINETNNQNSFESFDEEFSGDEFDEEFSGDEFDEEFSEDEFTENDSNKKNIKEESCQSLESYNRFMTNTNDYFYTYIGSPISSGYSTITNEPIRDGVSNFFHNLGFPLRIVNNLLQLKFKNSAEELGVFLLNSTLGIVGIFKPAQNYFDLETHDEDFGQTMGYYGVGAGCHIVIPILGPSNLRDMSSKFFDIYTDIFHYTSLTNTEHYGIVLYEKVNKFPNQLKTYKYIKDDAIDLYPYIKDMYEQNRKQQIKE